MAITAGNLIKKPTIAFVVFILICFPFYQLKAQGDLQLMPRRVVFEGNNKIEELNVINVGKDSATYNISLVQNRMREDGAFERITQPDSGQFFADKNIRFFPRSVTLGPGEAQTVKVQVIKTSQLSPGEYRSHLYFRAEPKQMALGQEEENSAEKDLEEEGIVMDLIPVFGLAIPVIIRIGESTTSVQVSELVILNKELSDPQLTMRFTRSGNMSVYGDLSVQYTSAKGKVTELGLVRGIAVYTPNAVREFRIPLKEQSGVDFRNGKIKVFYHSQNQENALLAESELLLYP